jgi:hypothetical protein
MSSPRLTAILLLASAGALGAQEVTLPLDRYDDLRQRARPVPVATPAPPAAHALEAAQIEIVAGKETARVTQRLTLSLFASGWQEIALPGAGSLTAAELGSLEGRVKSDGQLTLVARGQGRHVVVLTSVVALTEDATAARVTRTLSLPLPPTAAVSGTITTSDEQIQEIAIAANGLTRGATSARRVEFVGASGATLVARFLGPGRTVDRAKMPLKFTAVAATLTEVSRTRTKVTGWITANVLSGQLDKLKVDLPSNLEVAAVHPKEVGWDLEGGRLVVTPLASVEKSLTLTVELTGASQAAFASPLLVPAAATQVTLMSAVRAADDGYPTMADPAGARRAEPDDEARLTEEAREAGVPFFVVRDRQRAPRWVLEWPEKSKSLAAQVDRLRVNAILGETGRAAYECWAVVRSSGTTEIALKPPPGFEMLRVERDGIEVQPGASDGGLVVPLAAGSETQLVHVAGLLGDLALPEKGELALALPGASAPIASVEVQVSLPADRQYELAQQERRSGLGPEPVARSGNKGQGGVLAMLAPRSAARATREPAPFEAGAASTTVQAAWSAMTQQPAPLVIRVKPRRQKERWF